MRFYMSEQYNYKYGFETLIESETIPKGLSEDIIRIISKKKNEPEWVLDYRLKAYRHWVTLKDPTHTDKKWAMVNYPEINFQDLTYYSAPKQKSEKKSMDELDPEGKDMSISLIQRDSITKLNDFVSQTREILEELRKANKK